MGHGRWIIGLGAALAMSTSAATAAPRVAIEQPDAYGVVHLGQQVQVKLSGGCRKVNSRVFARVNGVSVAGRKVRGCSPLLTVPTVAMVTKHGYRPGQQVSFVLASGRTTRPLVDWRQQPSGLATVTDPFESLNGVALAAGDVLDLGRADLRGIQSLTVRNLASGLAMWEIRSGSATGPVVTRGTMGSLGTFSSAGADGWYHSVGDIERRPAGAARLYLALTFGSATVNFVDYNGYGAGEPHRFASDAGFATLFDGSTFDGWTHQGPGRFVLKDGAMRAEHELQDRGWAWQWYTREQFSDFVLHLRFKLENFEDNGGILLRHVDPTGDTQKMTDSGDEIQIQEGFENHTGGIAHEADAFRLTTGMVGQWNTLEVVAVGPRYVVRINGVETQRFTTAKELKGYIAVENEQLVGTKGGHLWYDDVRVHRCTGAADPLCATS